jgi:D-alanine-D-alanine ligase
VRTLILYTLPPDSLGDGRAMNEFDLSVAAAYVAKAIETDLVRAVYGRLGEILDVLRDVRPDVIYNLCEAPLGRPDLEPHAAALFEWAGVRFTGCGSETLALCRHKDRTGALLRAAGIGVPEEFDPVNPRFPCFVKPAAEDGSAGIHAHSLCHDITEVRRALKHLDGVHALVQEFVPGREFAVSLWGRADPEYHAITETTRLAGPPLITYENKWDAESQLGRAPAGPVDEQLEQQLLNSARASWKVVRARQNLRMDIRLDALGTPRVLDVNPNPALTNRGEISFGQAQKLPWDDLVRKMVEWA